MNKKGSIFLPLFILVVIVTLGVLAYTIETTKANRKDTIGLRAVSLLKTYDEAEKINLYIEQASKYSSQKAINELYTNAGFGENNKCRKIPATSAEPKSVILDKNCGVFDVEKTFKEIFSEEIKPYILNYKSTYQSFTYQETTGSGIFKTFGLIPKPVQPEQGDIFPAVSERNTKRTEIKEIIEKGDDLVLVFSEIELKVENSPESKYVFAPKAILKEQSLVIFDSLYEALDENCIKKEVAGCKSKLKNIFSDIVIEEQGNFLKITLMHQNKPIRLAIDIGESLPEKQSALPTV